MEVGKVFCDGCSRGCRVEITKKEGRYYISGNNCSRGEQTARENIPHLKECELIPKAIDEKKGFLGKLFGKGNK